MNARNALIALVAAMVTGAVANAAEWGLKEGTPDLKSAGPLAFGPDGILVLGDTKAATLYAIDTGDKSGDPNKVQLNVDGLNERVAEALSTSPADVTINDLAVNPKSGNLYLSVSKGTGAEQQPALVRVDGQGKIAAIPLTKVPFASVVLPDPPADQEQGEGRRRRNPRSESITDLAYTDGKVLVSGVTSATASASIREVPFPFVTADAGTSVEIYHGAHGRVEDNATPRVFVPFNIGDEPSLLAGFTCTPLVRFPLNELQPGKKVRGTTVAELGNQNRPLDMIVYKKDGKDYLLLANSARGVMRISTDNIENQEAITEPVPGGGTRGQPFETVENLKGVVQLDKLNASHAVVLVQHETGSQDLRTIELP